MNHYNNVIWFKFLFYLVFCLIKKPTNFISHKLQNFVITLVELCFEL